MNQLRGYLRHFRYAARAVIGRLPAAISRWKHVGRNTHIDRSVQVLGWRNTRIGDNCIISQDTWINVNNPVAGQVQMSIGDNSYIGRRNFFSIGGAIEIGAYALTGADCRFLGSDHNFDDPFSPYITTGTTDGARIVIGVNTWIGANATIIGDVTVGHGSVIGAGAVVLKDVPPFSVVVGSPGRVIRRFNFETRKWCIPSEIGATEAVPNEQEYEAGLRRAAPRPHMPLAAAANTWGSRR